MQMFFFFTQNPKPLILRALKLHQSSLRARFSPMAYAHFGRTAIRKTAANANLHSSDAMLNPLLYASQGIRYRKLEVILTTNIEKLGKAGETVKVAPGHFRNYLMPKLLAVPNIDKFAFLIKEQHKIFPRVEESEEVKVVQVSDGNKLKEYERAAKRLLNARLVLRRLINVEKFRSRSTLDEPIELQSAVTVDEIVAEVARQLCVQIFPENVKLAAPLSTVGEYEVPLRFPKSIPLPAGRLDWALNVKVRTK